MLNDWFVPEEKLNENVVFSEGEANFEVVSASPGIAKSSGLPMLTITLSVTDCNGTKGKMTDYLPQSQKAAWKIKSLLDSIGRTDLYTPSFFDNYRLIVGLKGKCELVIVQDVYNGVQYEKTKLGKFLKAPKSIMPESLNQEQVELNHLANEQVQKNQDRDDDDLPF